MKLLISATCAVLLLSNAASAQECKDLERKQDKFTGTFAISTPLVIKKTEKSAGTNIKQHKASVLSPITLSYNSDSSAYYVNMLVEGKPSQFRPSGLYILFANGEKIMRPQNPAVSSMMAGDLMYVTAARLTEEEVDKLSTLAISDLKVDQAECSLLPWFGEKLKAYFACLRSAEKK